VIADKLKYSKDVKKYDSLKVFEQKKKQVACLISLLIDDQHFFDT